MNNAIHQHSGNGVPENSGTVMRRIKSVDGRGGMDHATWPGSDRGAAVIFDIDGTLLRPGTCLQRVHMGSMAIAIEQISGIRAEFRYDGGDLFVNGNNLAGCTDAGTIDLVLHTAGVPASESPGLRAAVVENMCDLVAAATEGLDSGHELLPGTAELLTELRRRGVIVGLSTGNARAVASCKMRAAGLPGLEALGGFGDSHGARSDIARDAVAAVRAAAGTRGQVLGGTGVVLIGDTTSDVGAARAAGVRCVGVATGPARAHELERAGADLVVPTMEELRVRDLAELVHADEGAYPDGAGDPGNGPAPAPYVRPPARPRAAPSNLRG
ncbi:HAD family hydrolase [Streptomyces viridosporus]|uniref:HAD family hydrolase n=1 Tax=Streptomyces viridosporus TaxID=67581 RepID=UPI003431BC46